MTAAPLLNITAAIVHAHTAATVALRDAVAHAVHAGELLMQAKAAMPHGAFGGFCAALPFAETTARGYMRLARLDPANRQRVADMPLRAALLALAEPPAELRAARTATEIPMGSHGVYKWCADDHSTRWLELHPALWPDGITTGLHYALAVVTASGSVTCDASRRPVRMGPEQIAEVCGAPFDRLQVVEGPPVLWALEGTA